MKNTIIAALVLAASVAGICLAQNAPYGSSSSVERPSGNGASVGGGSSVVNENNKANND